MIAARFHHSPFSILSSAALALLLFASAAAAAPEVHLQWVAGSDPAKSPATGFRVERSTVSATAEDSFFRLNYVRGETRYVDAQVQPGQQYWWRVWAYNTKGDSELPTNVVSVIIHADGSYTIVEDEGSDPLTRPDNPGLLNIRVVDPAKPSPTVPPSDSPTVPPVP